MAKETRQDLEKLQDSLTRENAATNALEVLAAFENVDKKQLVQLNAEYLTMEQNKVYNFIFVGMGQILDKKGENVQTVELLDKNGNKFITGGTVIVNTLKKVEQLPCLVKIITHDLIDGKNGEYLSMEIFTVPLKKSTASAPAKDDLPF